VGGGADLVVETSGQLGTLAQAIDLVRIGGCILPFGIYTETEAALSFYQLYFKELQILNARAAKGGTTHPVSIWSGPGRSGYGRWSAMKCRLKIWRRPSACWNHAMTAV
jgi:Zinc-binding dehydrogenase